MSNKNKKRTSKLLYTDCKRYLSNKDDNVYATIQDMLVKTSQMFDYEGLPDSIPKRELEHMLQVNGNVFVTKVDDKLYAFTGGEGGPLDEYYRPTIYTVANPYLNISKEYRIGVDGVRVLNDSEEMGLMPIIGKYAAMICDAENSLDVAAILARITMLITAPDDRSKASADEFVRKIFDEGEFSAIGDSQLFDGIKGQSMMDSAQRLQQLIETLQYLKASLYNELGIGAATNLKRERINVAEVEQSNSVLIPFVYDMLKCRQLYFDDVNRMFGTSIVVTPSSVWVNYDNIDDSDNSSNGTVVVDAPRPPMDETNTDGAGEEGSE